MQMSVAPVAERTPYQMTLQTIKSSSDKSTVANISQRKKFNNHSDGLTVIKSNGHARAIDR